MKTVIYFLHIILLLTAFSIQVEQTSQQNHQLINKPVNINWSVLKEFPNKTGSTFGDAQLRSLINFISFASYNYGVDAPKNMEYIKHNMDVSFGDSNHHYNVVIEYAGVRDLGDATFYCEGGSNFAFIGYGVNLRYPQWTYLVYRLGSNFNVSYTSIAYEYNRGSGLTAQSGTKIGQIIKNLEDSKACDCSLTTQIVNQLENTISGYWNVMCQSTQNIFSLVGIYNSTWIMTKPAKCTYFAYAIQ